MTSSGAVAHDSPFTGRTAWVRNLETPLRAFLRTETGSALVLLAAALAALALAPARPSGVLILTRRLTNDTDLQWAANKEPDLAGYEVVWRDTSEAVWTHSVWVGNVTSYTVKLSKDNYFFGVRAIDNDGYRSPVSFPVPASR